MYGIRKIIQTTSLAVLVCISAAAQDSRLGKVTGTIYDYKEAVIVGSKVTVSNDKFQKTAYPDPQTGAFLFELPTGIYSITTEQNWWFPIRRAKFMVTEDKTVVINLQPELRIASQALVIDKKGAKDVYEKNLLSNLVEFMPFSDSPLDAVIEYRRSKRSGTTTKYSHAQLTYNDLSIRADVLIFNTQTRSIEASGNVTIDKGGSRQKTNRITERLIPIK